MRLFALFVCVVAGLMAADPAAEPPVRDHVSLAAVTLCRLSLGVEKAWPGALLPTKSSQLPNSVRLYLKPSGQLNSLSRPVQKAAAAVRRRLAPGKAQEKALRDPGQVAAGVDAYLSEHMTLTAQVEDGRRPATDQRLAWPSAGAILARGTAEAWGLELARVAILRALKVPARTCWAGGRLRTQYWQPLKAETVKPAPTAKKGKKPRGSAPGVLGRWELAGGLGPGETVDAWSLDQGTLSLLRWEPAQELSVAFEAYERVYFPEELEIDARAAHGVAAREGRIVPGHPGMASPEAFWLASPTATVLALTLWRVRLSAEGSLAAMEPVDLASPYQAHLGSWRHEAPPRLREMAVEAAALWSDRPERLKLRQGKPVDEWTSPPPALGVLHYLSCGVRRPGAVLEAAWSGGRIQGKLLRADNLAPKAGAPVYAEARSSSAAAVKGSTLPDGSFSFELDEALRSATAIRLGEEPLSQAKPRSESLWLWPSSEALSGALSVSLTPAVK